jgi:hypothetical protein
MSLIRRMIDEMESLGRDVPATVKELVQSLESRVEAIEAKFGMTPAAPVPPGSEPLPPGAA